MQQNLIDNEQQEILSSVSFLVGDRSRLVSVKEVSATEPFNEQILDYLNTLSKKLMASREAKAYPDIITLGFWIRKSSMLKLKKRFVSNDGNIHMGRGIAFHIAPSNVPVNYAYSLVTGLITGNANIVRIPSKDFPQVRIINREIAEALKKFPALSDYIYLVRYERNQKINDIFSSIADTRIVWGGDSTITELRKSPLSARAGEVAFADRYSLAIIDSNRYLDIENKERIAEEFYNDTYLTDQNACTSPRMIVWVGKERETAKEMFWQNLHELVKKKYIFQPIMGVNKLTSAYLLAATYDGVKQEQHADNLLIRVKIEKPDDSIIKFKESAGYFFECDCDDIMELRELCNNTHCQTIGFLGEKEVLIPLLMSGIKGVDRVVPIGRTMDFDLIWDGYNLYERLTRTISFCV